jgi:hypothetical protein
LRHQQNTLYGIAQPTAGGGDGKAHSGHDRRNGLGMLLVGLKQDRLSLLDEEGDMPSSPAWAMSCTFCCSRSLWVL